MRFLLVLVLLPIALLAACNRSGEPAAVTPAATVAAPATVEAPAPAPATVAAPVGMSDAPAPGEHTTFDAKGFAGTFGDANSAVTFTADGAYSMTTESVAAKAPDTGTWTLEPDARHIRLDPNSKAEQDRVYELVSNDELHGTGGQVLMRTKQ
jgi:copper homeostasis protein (lipoprotein)